MRPEDRREGAGKVRFGAGHARDRMIFHGRPRTAAGSARAWILCYNRTLERRWARTDLDGRGMGWAWAERGELESFARRVWQKNPRKQAKSVCGSSPRNLPKRAGRASIPIGR